MYQAAGAAQAVKYGIQTSGRIPGGATVEREIANTLDDLDTLRLALHTPDFTTANRIEQAINARMGAGTAFATDLGTVDLHVPPAYSHQVTALLAQVERIEVKPDTPARVVIDEKSGTIVVGAEVKLDPVAVTHGNLTVRVTETPTVSQPGAFSRGQTKVLPGTQIDVNEHSERRLQHPEPQRDAEGPGRRTERAGPGAARSDPGAERPEGGWRVARGVDVHLSWQNLGRRAGEKRYDAGRYR